MEKLVDTSKSIHDKIVKTMIKRLDLAQYKKIIDAGSGKTSASILLKYFPNAQVDAVIYPGDNRKKNPLENAIGSNRLEVVEADICKSCFRKKYDLCLAHLTLGEAHNFGNHFSDLFHQLMGAYIYNFRIIHLVEFFHFLLFRHMRVYILLLNQFL